MCQSRDMTSDIFELITDDDTRFYVHSDVLTSQSTPFHLAVTGPWKEATERRILLADWDTDTVSRLVEFLYTGDYAYPNPIPLGDSLAPERSIAPKPENTTTGPAEAELDSNRPLTPFSTCLRNHLRPNRAPRVPDVQRLGPFDPAEFDYAAVLLAHARVYVLANYKAVEYLQTLALKRVQLVLSRLQPLITDSQTTGNVAEFAEYVYANTSQLSVSEEPLRKITSLFIALNMVDFHSEGRAVALMAKGGDLVTDVMAKLRRRMLDPDDPCSSSSPLRGRYISYIAVRIQPISSIGTYPANFPSRSCQENLGANFLARFRRKTGMATSTLVAKTCKHLTTRSIYHP